MYELVAAGHVYVAQPPLFRVRNKSNTYYVQTEDEMRTQLLDMGLADAVFDPADGRLIEGEPMARLVRTLATLEESIIALERRGISLKMHAMRQDAKGRLPIYHVYLDGRDEWFTTREELDNFVAAQETQAGGKVNVDVGLPASQPSGANAPPSANGDERHERIRIIELHEVRTINMMLADLAKHGFTIDALIPQERTGVEEARYKLRRGENVTGLEDLRGLPGAIRSAGEKGLQITRFKGLGEMNAEELRDTTLDPTNRTLLQIRMEDVSGADDLFRVLMGDQVEPRREFIQKHALDVRNLDV
jgi:DNA gyrase subunit B